MTNAEYAAITRAVYIARRDYSLPPWIDTDDLTQIVAETYMGQKKRGKNVRDLSGWSVTVTHNHIRSLFRHTALAARYAAQIEIEELQRRRAVAPPNPEEHAIATDLIDKLSRQTPDDAEIVCTPSCRHRFDDKRRYRARRRLWDCARRSGFVSSLDITPRTTRTS